MYEPPAGWYLDPATSQQLRYWDGRAWTEHVGPLVLNQVPLGGNGKFKPSKELVGATYRQLIADKSLVGFLFAAGVVAAAVAGAIEFPAIVWWHLEPSFSSGGPWGVLIAAAAMGASSLVIQLATGTVVAHAMTRAEGQSPSLRRSLAMAWARRRQLLAWALVSTLVGAASRLLERFGIGGLIARLFVDLGWAVATVFAMPVVMVEGTMPLATVRRSAQIVKAHFFTTIVSNLRLALPWVVASIAALITAVWGGIWLAFGAGDPVSTVVAATMLVAGIVAVCFCITVSAALTAYLEAFLYRYALGLSVPGIDPALMPTRRPSV